MLFANYRFWSYTIFISEKTFFTEGVSNTHYAAKVSNLRLGTNKAAEKNKEQIRRNFRSLSVNELTRLQFEDEWVFNDVLESVGAYVFE